MQSKRVEEVEKESGSGIKKETWEHCILRIVVLTDVNFATHFMNFMKLLKFPVFVVIFWCCRIVGSQTLNCFQYVLSVSC